MRSGRRCSDCAALRSRILEKKKKNAPSCRRDVAKCRDVAELVQQQFSVGGLLASSFLGFDLKFILQEVQIGSPNLVPHPFFVERSNRIQGGIRLYFV